MGEELDLINPKSFNQKIQWLKLYDRNPKYTKLVDKYEVKFIVDRILGTGYTFPTIGVWSHFSDIDFNGLPNEFVLKCTHDSGSVVIVKNKELFSKEEAKEKLEISLKRNFFYAGREWPYKNVRPRIIAEEYLEDVSNLEYTDLPDYKFMCFGGKVKCIFTCTERFSKTGVKVTFFDTDWKVMPFERHYPKSTYQISKPKNYEKMLELAEKLATGIPFVRVDFYEVGEKIYFGEMTFYPGCGFEEFSPKDWDYTLGKWIELAKR